MSALFGPMSRRSALRILNLGAAGLALGCFGSKRAGPAGAGAVANADAAGAEGFRPSVFLHLQPDGLVNVVCHRSEMGQSVRSTLPVLIADELGADMARVRIVQCDGNKAYGDQNTDGSSSIRKIYEQMREVGAAARAMLVSA
ncbi:MAG: molybdopterin cofactor-binding domain-containing protein, partial [Myxococcales bacterium]